MMGAHSQIHAPAEAHILTPLAHLGYYERVETAPYDPIISQRGIREVVQELPSQESDYLEALRAYSDRLYSGLLEGRSEGWLLDKTPAYALVLDFAARLYPDAHYVVLTRHPMAIWSSVVDSFFDGDHEMAHRQNALLERYVPAIADFLRERPVPILHLHYETLVADPERAMADVCNFVGIEYENSMVNYGQASPQHSASRGLGDPMTVAAQTRPTTASLEKWATQWTGRPERVDQARWILASLDESDLEVWGYPKQSIEDQLAAIDPAAKRTSGPALSRHVLERRILMALRRRVGNNLLGRGIRKIRELCDLLLR